MVLSAVDSPVANKSRAPVVTPGYIDQSVSLPWGTNTLETRHHWLWCSRGYVIWCWKRLKNMLCSFPWWRQYMCLSFLLIQFSWNSQGFNIFESAPSADFNWNWPRLKIYGEETVSRKIQHDCLSLGNQASTPPSCSSPRGEQGIWEGLERWLQCLKCTAPQKKRDKVFCACFSSNHAWKAHPKSALWLSV